MLYSNKSITHICFDIGVTRTFLNLYFIGMVLIYTSKVEQHSSPEKFQGRHIRTSNPPLALAQKSRCQTPNLPISHPWTRWDPPLVPPPWPRCLGMWYFERVGSPKSYRSDWGSGDGIGAPLTWSNRHAVAGRSWVGCYLLVTASTCGCGGCLGRTGGFCIWSL